MGLQRRVCFIHVTGTRPVYLTFCIGLALRFGVTRRTTQGLNTHMNASSGGLLSHLGGHTPSAVTLGWGRSTSLTNLQRPIKTLFLPLRASVCYFSLPQLFVGQLNMCCLLGFTKRIYTVCIFVISL